MSTPRRASCKSPIEPPLRAEVLSNIPIGPSGFLRLFIYPIATNIRAVPAPGTRAPFLETAHANASSDPRYTHRPTHLGRRRRAPDPRVWRQRPGALRPLPDARRVRLGKSRRIHRRLPVAPAPWLRNHHLYAGRPHAPPG